jgi:hypothetical protein
MTYKFHGVFSEMNREKAAYTIQTYWREKRYNPRNGLCYRIEMKNIDMLYIEYGIGSREELEKHIPNFRDRLMRYRIKEFREDLNKTTLVLRNYINMKNRVSLKARRKK